jgi:predicted membrane metal-binding protein
MVSFRTLLLTLLFALLGMAVGLLAGIIATLVMAAVHHAPPNMTNAYRHAAIPAALASGAGAFIWNAVRAVRDMVRRRR